MTRLDDVEKLAMTAQRELALAVARLETEANIHLQVIEEVRNEAERQGEEDA